MNQENNILDLQDLLARSWQEIKNRFLPFFLLAACAPAAALLVQGILIGFDPIQTSATQPALWQSLTASILTTFFSAWFISALVLYICKHTQTLTESWSLALYRLPRVLMGMLAYLLIVGTGFVLAFGICWLIFYILSAAPLVAWGLIGIWGLFFLMLLFVTVVYWIFVPYLLLLTDLSILTCFTSSYQLVKGHFWHTVGLLLLIILIATVVSVISMLAIAMLGGIAWVLWPASRYIVSVLAVIPGALMALIYQVPLIALYLDLSPTVGVSEHN